MRVLPRSPWGATAALLVATAGLAPSLLPRPTVVAIGLCGLLLAVGYAAGTAVEAVIVAIRRRRLTDSPVAGPRWPWAVAAVAALWWLVTAVRAAAWQEEQAAALGMPDPGTPVWLLAVGGVVVLLVLVLIGRGLRAVSRAVARRARARLGAPVATALGAIAAVALVAVVLGGAFLGTKAAFARIDSAGAGLAAPTSPLRSGGPGSVVSFDGLGAEGQAFVTGGPDQADLSAYAGRTARPTIRVYVGLGNAPTVADRVDLALQELRRTGALQRRLLVVAVSTGNGFLDPDLVSSPELLEAGDVATVSLQYSVLPSWLSFLVDGGASEESATELWRAVRAAVDELPTSERPLLAISGESLGAFGGQAVFRGEQASGVVAQADAAVWVGSPAASALWPTWRDQRSGGPPWQPVIGTGEIARAPVDAGSLQWTQPGWGTRRVVLTQHANDPVAWWSPDLLLSRPDWLDDPRGPGVDPRITWWPVVTFLQVGLDLAAAGAVPPGVGHDYADVTGRAWAAALSAPGASGAWSDMDTARLDDALHGRSG
jgi:uncharacterized membrane protein